MPRTLIFLLALIFGCASPKPSAPQITEKPAPVVRAATQSDDDANVPEKRGKIEENLRYIGVEALIYADEHEGRLPDFSEFSHDGKIVPLFLPPGDPIEIPSDWQTMPAQDRLDWLSARSSFRYIAGGLEYARSYSIPADKIVIAYESNDAAPGGVDVLYLDMHVEFTPSAVFNQRMKETRQLLQSVRGNE